MFYNTGPWSLLNFCSSEAKKLNVVSCFVLAEKFYKHFYGRSYRRNGAAVDCVIMLGCAATVIYILVS
jgi:hypothetical protein